MSLLAGWLADLRALSPGALALRLTLLVAPLLALLLTGVEESGPHGWLVALVVVLSLGWAAMPESLLGTADLVAVLLWWTVEARPDVPLSVVPAALLLLAAHVAGVLLSYGPPTLRIQRWLAVRWLRRGATVGVAAPAVWAVAVAVGDQPEPPGIWVAGLVGAVVVCVAAAVALTFDEKTR